MTTSNHPKVFLMLYRGGDMDEDIIFNIDPTPIPSPRNQFSIEDEELPIHDHRFRLDDSSVLVLTK